MHRATINTSTAWSRLKAWAEPLKLQEHRLTVHVIEAVDPAAAILEFAAANQIDHILIGARQDFTAAQTARQRVGQGRRRGHLHGNGRASQPHGKGRNSATGSATVGGGAGLTAAFQFLTQADDMVDFSNHSGAI